MTHPPRIRQLHHCRTCGRLFVSWLRATRFCSVRCADVMMEDEGQDVLAEIRAQSHQYFDGIDPIAYVRELRGE